MIRTIRCLTGVLVTSFLCGCVSLPAIVSSDAFTGKVVDRETGQPAPDILVVGEFSSQVAAWDNSGDDEQPKVICEDYAISNANGQFSFPSFSGISGASVYSFNQNHGIVGPYFLLSGIGYCGSGTSERAQPAKFFVKKCPNSGSSFYYYLKGEKALHFRKEDYPVLLRFLENWYAYNNQHLRPNASDTELYQKYKALFTSE